MHEDWRTFSNDPSHLDLVRRFEEMVANGDRLFFDVEELEVLVDYYLDRREIRRARFVLDYANKLFPENLGMRLREAHVLAASGQHVRAIPLLKSILQVEPDNEEAHLNLGSIYSQMQEHRLAIQHFQQALQTADEEMRRDLHLDIALEFENMGDWRQAIRHLRASLEEDPENETALYELAFCYERTAQFEEATRFFEAFLNERPYSFGAWYSLGNIHQLNNRFESAVEAYELAIAIEDSFGPAYLQKAEALMSLDKHEAALETFHEVLEREPASAPTLCFMGECLERMEDWDKARAYYLECLALDPDWADAEVGLGVIADALGDLKTAARHFQRAVDLQPETIDYLLLLASILKKLGEHDRAEAELLKALKWEPNHPDVWLERVDNALVAAQPDKALAIADTALHNDSAAVNELQARRMVAFYGLGRDAEAFTLLESLLVSDPETVMTIVETFPALANDARFTERLTRFKN
jgi:tetratricopeptide (TPR) repeat protein